MKTVCVIGLGYIGLPTAAVFAANGYSVIGVDVNEQIVAKLCEGRILIEEPGLADIVQAAVRSGTLKASSSPIPSDTFIIAVPTPILEDHTADLGAVAAAARSLVPHIRPGCLVVLESTSPPGTTMKLVLPILEKSGLKAGKDFMLCYSPERVLPGRILSELIKNDRVMGGITSTSAEAARDLYSSFVKGTIFTTDATTAEMVKVMENTFRDVNIALANEFALIAGKLGINIWEAIGLANRHPRVNVLNPGPGVGGHCIAVDPWFLVEVAPFEARLVRLAREINDGMPSHVVGLVAAMLGKRRPEDCILVCLGLTFKANVGDTRESPALQIVELLRDTGYQVRCVDPHVPTSAFPGLQIAASAESSITGAHLILLLVDHDEFRMLMPSLGGEMAARNLIDTRNMFDAVAWRTAGFRVSPLGHV